MNLRTLLLFFLVPAAAGCASKMPLHVPFESRPHDSFPGTARPGEPEYRIGVGDQLALTVRRHDEFNGSFSVDRQGNIRLPLVLDRVQAQGLTVPELEAEISKVLRPYLVREPTVRVDLFRPNSRFIYVLGAVIQPGKYAMGDERLYVREALVRAGWPRRGVAALKRAKLVSSTPETNDIRKVNLKQILYEGDLTENYELKPNDIVWVPYTYVAEFVFQAKLMLEPLAVLLGFDVAAERLSYGPRAVRNRDARDWQYDGTAPNTGAGVYYY